MVRKAVYAGQFYPDGAGELSKMIDKLLSSNKPEKKVAGNVRAAIVPHAGYIYSGPIAATAYNALRASAPQRIILLGPSHQSYLCGARTFASDWETPLGTSKVKPAEGLEVVESDMEHSLEVQLPFLQKVFKKFVLMPIIYGDISPIELAEKILHLVSPDSIIVASSDFSHYLPYEAAKRVDSESIKRVVALDIGGFDTAGDACGKTGISTLMRVAKKKKWKPLLLDYRNSGDTAGDKSGVVGYAAIVFVE